MSVGSTYEQQFNSLQDIKDYHTKVGSLITVPVDVTVQVTKNGVPLGEQQQTRYFAADSTRDTIYADNTLSEEDKAKVWDTIQKSISSSNTKYTVFETRRIQNVAPGLIGLNSTDAINGSQLFATNQMLGNLVGSLKKTLGDSVTVSEDGQITVAGDIDTLGWIAKAGTVNGSNGTVTYDADKKTDETEEAKQARIAKLEKDGYIVDASKVMTFKAGKNIGLVQKPGEFSISTIDTPSFKSVELRGETKEVNGSQVTPVTMMDSSGMQVYTETVTPGDAGPTTTKKVSTTVNNGGVTTDGTVKVTNGEDGGKDLVSLGKGSATTGDTDQDFGTIHVDGKQGADGTITIDRGTKSLTDTANVGKDREQEIGANNPVAGMDRITYTTKGPNNSTINHEVATLDDGFFLTTSKDVANDKAAAGVKLNDTIQVVDGKNTTVSAITHPTTGVHEFHIDVTGLPVVYTDKDGNKLTKVGDKFYKDDQFDNGTLKPNATPSEAKNISIVNPDGSISKTDGSAPTTVNNVGSSIGGDVNNGAPKGSTINGEPGNNSFIDNLNKVGGTGNDAISKNAVVTTGDLKNLADTPLFFSGDAADGKEYNGATNTKNTFGRKLSEEAKIVGGVTTPANLTDNNIGVVSNGSDTLTIKLAKQLTGLDSATYTSPTTKTDDGKATSTMKVDGNGVRFVEANGDTVNNTPTFTTDGITGGNKTITDVASGIGGKVKDPDKKGANTFLENVNKIGKEEGGQPAADAISENVVVNAKDLKNLVDTGFKLNTSGQPADLGASTVKIGETINVINGVNTKVSAIDDTVNGTHTFHIDVTGMPISYTDGEGNALTKIGDNYYKNTDIEDGKPKDNAVAVPADKVTNNVKVVNKDGGTTEQGSIGNVKSVFDSTIGNGGDTGSQIDDINDANKVEKVPGTNKFIKDLTTLKGDTPADKEKLNSVSTVGDLQKVALTPLFFEGDTAESATTKNAFGRKLSEKAKILGGQKDVTKLTDNNIGVVSNGSDTLTIKLAKELQDLDSVKVSNGKDGDDAKDLVTIGKEVNSDAAPGTDGENGTIGLNGKNGSEAVITIDRGTKSMNDKVNLGTDPSQDISGTNTAANMDRITYTTKGPNDSTINHEVATLDDGFFLTTSKDVANKKAAAGVKLNDTIQFNDGTNTKVSTVTSEKGVHELHIDVSGLPVSYTDNDGDAVTKIGDKYYKSNQVVDGKPIDGATEVPADQVTNNIKLVNTDGTTNAPGTISNVASGIGGEVKDPAHNNENTFIENINKVGKKSDDGTAAPDAISENTVVNAKDLKNVVDTGFKLNTSGHNGDAQTVKIGDTIKVIDGANTKVSAIDDSTTGTHTFHIDVNGLPMSYVDSDGNPLTKIGDKFYKTSDLVNGVPPAGTAEVPANKVTSNVSMLDNTGSHTGVAPQIKNVGSGLVDNNGKTIKPNELLNMTDANNPVLKNAVNVGDLKQVAAAAKTEVTGTGEAFVTDTEEEDGHIIYNVHVDKILSHKDAAGNELVRGGDGKYYTNEAIKDKTYIPSENKWYSNSDLTDGKPNKDAQEVTPNPVDQSNVKTSLVNPNKGVGTGTDTSMTLDNVKSGIGGDAGNGIKGGTTVDGTQGNNTFIKNLDKVGGTGEGAIDKTTVVNAGDLKNLADTPLFFSGDAADGKEYNGATNTKNTFGRKLSEEAKIVGGVTTPANLTDNNIGVVSNGSDTLTIKLAKQLTGLDSATYTSPTIKTDDGDATSTMKVDGNGIRFVGDNNVVKTDAPSLTTDGITGGNKQITNVGSGLKDGDTTISISDLDDSEKWPNTNPIWNNAVNVGDLKKAKDAATTEVTGSGKAIVTKKTASDGHATYNVHVDPVVDVVATDGKTPVVRGDDGKYYNQKDIENKTYIPNEDGNGGNWYNKSDIGNDGQPKEGAPVQKITPTDVKNNFVNPNGTGSIVLDNVKSGIGGEVKDPAHNNKNTFIDNINKVGKKSDDGTAAPDAISENTVVNAKDLKNVVDTGFKLNTSGHSGDAQTVKIGETIKVVDGANTKVSDITSKDGVHEFHIDVTGLPVTYTATETDGEGKPTGTPVDVTKTKDGYQKADGTPLIKINENGKDVYYTADQLDNNVPKSGAKGLTITDNIRLINPKDGTGATKITNVAAGTDDTDAVNVSQLKEMAAGASTEVTGTGKAIVTSKKGDAGQTVYNVHVDPVVEVQSKDGSEVTRGGDGKYYKTSDIADKVYVPNADGNGGNWYNKTDVTDGKPNTGANPQTPAALKQSDIKTSLVNPNAGVDPTSTDNSIILDNVKSGIGGDAGNNGIPKDSTIDGTTGDNSFIKNLDTVGKAGGIDKNTVVNAGDLKNLADTPLFFTGDSADGVAAADGSDKNTFGRKLSEEMKIVGGVKLGVDANTDPQARKKAIADKLTDGNIGVISDGTNMLTVKLAKELTDLTSVTTGSGDNTTTMTAGGTTTTSKVDDIVKTISTAPNGMTTTEQKVDATGAPTGESKTTMVTPDGVTVTTGTTDGQTTKTALNKDGLATDGKVVVTNGKDGDAGKELVTIDKVVDANAPAGTDGEHGQIGLDGKNGSEATITINRGTKSLADGKNIALDPTKPVGKNNPMSMDRITYATKGADGSSINHEVATMDDGFLLTTSGDVSAAQSPTKVAMNHTITIVDGANTKVSKVMTDSTGAIHELHIDVNGLPTTYVDGDGKPITKVGGSYVDADGETLVKVGDAYYRKSQLNNPDDPAAGVKPGEQDKGVTFDVKLVSPGGITNAPKLNNVGSSLVKGDGTRITMGDLNDSATYPATNPIWNSAVNVGDLKAASDAAKTEVTGTGAADVTKLTAADGHDVYNVHVDKLMTVTATDPSKTIKRGGDGKYYNEGDIDGKTFVPNGQGGGNWYNSTDVDQNTGKPLAGKNPLPSDQAPQALNQNELKNSIVNPNGDDPTVLDNVKSGIGGAVKDADKQDANTFLENVNKIGKKDGDQPTADAISENVVVNAKDLKNLVDTGFKLNTSGQGDAGASTVKIGDTINVVDGANTKVSAITSTKDGTHTFHIDVTGLPMTYTAAQFDGDGKVVDGSTVNVSKVGDTYQTEDGTKLVNVGGKYYKPNQLDSNGQPKDGEQGLTVTNSISLQNPNSADDPATLKNVGSGLKDANGNPTSIDKAVGSNAVNVDDLRTMGKAATTEVTGSGAAEVTKVKGADGQNIYNVHVDKLMTVKPVDANTDIARGGDGKYYDAKDIAGKTFVPSENKWYNTADVDENTGKPLKGKTPLDNQPTAVDQNKLKNSVVNPNGDDPTVLDNVKSGIGGEVKDAAGNNTFIDNINKVGKKSDDGTAAPDAISENTVVNAKDLKNVVDTGFKLNTSGHSGDAQTVKIGDTIKVVDGANTRVSDITPADDGTHTFHIDVTGLPVTYTATKTDANGTPTGEPVDVSKVGDGYQLADGTKLVKVGDKYYTPDQLENGKPKPDAEGLTIKESVSLTQDNSAPATLERVGSGRRNGMDASEKPMDWNTILNPTGENEDKVNNMLTNAANIGDVRDAMQSVTEAGKGGGFGLTGNNGTVTQNLGKTITVKGGIANAVDEKTGDDLNTPEKSTTDKNTYVNVKDITGADGTTSKEMVVEIAKDLTDLDSVTVGEVGADGNTDGVTKITKDGMNTKVVENGKTKSTDVSADGVTVTDADGRTNTSTATKNELVDGKNKNTSTATKNELTDGDNTNTSTATENKLTDKDGNTNTSTSTETKLSDKEGDKTTSIKAGDMTVSKKNDKGETGSTHVDGGTITLENKDKDGKALDAKTEVSNKGMTITPVDKDGNAVTDSKKQVSITDKGLNNGGNQIINVDSGLGSVKLKDATGDMLNNAVNVGDLKEAINNAQTAVDGDGAAEISKSVDDNGRPTYKVHVDKLVEAKADDGKAIVRGSDNKFYYKDESLQQGTDGKWYAPDQLNPDNTPVEGAVGKATTELTVVPQDKLKTSLVNPNGDGATKLDNIKSAIGGEVKDANGNNTFIDNLNNVGKIGADGKPIIGEDAAVTTGDLKNLADTPLYFSGDRAENATGQNKFDRKLSEETKIVGGAKGELSDNNIGVISNGKDTLTVKLSKDLKDLNTIEVNDSISVGKDGDSTVIKGSETTSSFTEVATGPDGQPLYEVDEKGEVVRDANGDPIPVTKTSSTTTKGGTVTIKDSNVATGPDGKPLYKVDKNGNPILDEKGHKIPITESSSTTTKGGITESVVEKAEVDGDKPLIDENGNPITSKSTTTTGGGKLATDVENVKMVDGKPVTSHETTTIDGSHFESKDKDGNYTTINGGEIKSYDKDTNGSVTIKGDSLTASSKDENGHDKVTNISSDGFNSTATTFERDGNGQIVRNPDTGLPKEVTNSTNINSDGFTATRTDSEGNEVLRTTMRNGNIAIEKPQPIIDPTTGEAYKVLDKDGNWVPAHGYTKISDNGFEIQGINQSGTGISKVRLSSEGLDNGGNRITHVAEGVAPDDAVNVSQLRGLAQNINNDIANVGANAAALAGLKAIQYDPLEPTQIMAAVGTYRGKQAAALGIAHYKNEDTMFHMGVSIGSDHTMANIGVTYKFGRTDEKKAVPDRYKAGPISSTYVLQDEMVALKEENARMRANDEKMNAAYDEILDLVKQLKQDNEEMKKKLEKLEKK